MSSAAVFVVLMSRLRALVRRSASSRRTPPTEEVYGIEPADQAIIDQVAPYTMTGPARIEGLLAATSYVVGNELEGAFVECGVWRGGSMLAVILRLLDLGVTDRDLYLYDTFEGMTEPTVEDVSDFNEPAVDAWRAAQSDRRKLYEGLFSDEVFDETSVRARLVATGYPEDRLHFVRGKVEETIPGTLPDQIALLRLDTDWYQSTRHEMEHLYPNLRSGGVLIIDDYGHWQGSRQAVEEYFAVPGRRRPLLQRVDYTCRQGVKP